MKRMWRGPAAGMILLLCLLGMLQLAPCASAAPAGTMSPGLAGQAPVQITINTPGGRAPLAAGLKAMLFLTALAVIPILLLTLTSFTRIIVVFGFMRTALGTQQMPPNPVLIGLALFLTFIVMRPVWSQVNRQGLAPYLDGKITETQAWERGSRPLREFLVRQTRKSDLDLYYEAARVAPAASPVDAPMDLLTAAFVTSELKTAFQIGFVLFLPFMVIDLVVASVLTSMGMLMLPPVMISLPFKILVFVLVDGWGLLVRSMITSFR